MMQGGPSTGRWGMIRTGALHPITSQHGDLSPLVPSTVADLDVGTSPDGIKAPQVPMSPHSELRSPGGSVGTGASFQPREHPRSLPSINWAKREFTGELKHFKQNYFPVGMGGVSPRCHVAPRQKESVPEKQNETKVSRPAAAS